MENDDLLIIRYNYFEYKINFMLYSLHVLVGVIYNFISLYINGNTKT